MYNFPCKFRMSVRSTLCASPILNRFVSNADLLVWGTMFFTDQTGSNQKILLKILNMKDVLEFSGQLRDQVYTACLQQLLNTRKYGKIPITCSQSPRLPTGQKPPDITQSNTTNHHIEKLEPEAY